MPVDKTSQLLQFVEQLIEQKQTTPPNKLLDQTVDGACSTPFTITIKRQIAFAKSLNKLECAYLLLVASGYIFADIVKQLKLDEVSTKRLQHSVRQKLGCNTDAQAVYQGILYGSLPHFSTAQVAFIYLITLGYDDEKMLEQLTRLDSSIIEYGIDEKVRKPLYEKLNCKNDAQLMMRSIEEGIITGLNQMPDC